LSPKMTLVVNILRRYNTHTRVPSHPVETLDPSAPITRYDLAFSRQSAKNLTAGSDGVIAVGHPIRAVSDKLPSLRPDTELLTRQVAENLGIWDLISM